MEVNFVVVGQGLQDARSEDQDQKGMAREASQRRDKNIETRQRRLRQEMGDRRDNAVGGYDAWRKIKSK